MHMILRGQLAPCEQVLDTCVPCAPCMYMQVSAKDARKRRGSSGCEQHDLPRSRCPHLKREGGELEAWQDEVLSTPADVEVW